MAIALYAKRIAIFLACLALGLVVLAIATIWLAGREGTLQWATERLATATGGELTMEGVQGSLYGPVKIQRILYENATQKIEARDVELDWSPPALADYLLHINRATVATLEIHSKQVSDEPITLPSSLRLPLDIRVDEARINTLSITGKDKAPVVLTDLAATAESRGAMHTVNLTAFDSPWASGNARIKLGADKPFSLNASGHATGRTPRAFTLDLKAGDSLETIQLSANAATQGGKAVLEAKITPFAKALIQTFSLNAQDVDLHDFGAGLPFTQLIANAAGAIDEKGAVNARVNATNALPGTIDQQRLPLKTLRGELAGTVENFAVRNLSIDLGSAGQFTGTGGMRENRAEITLATGNLNVQGIHGKLRDTHAAGTLALIASGKDFAEQRLQVDLSDSKLNMRLRADVTHAGDDLRIASTQLTAAGGELSAQGRLGLAGKQAFDFAGKLYKLNPAAFGKFPVASISADLKTKGELGAPMQANVEFTIADSTLRGQPLSGAGKVDIAPNRIANADIKLDLAGNRLETRGSFGRAGDELAWQLDATDLSRVDPSLAGHARGKGTLRGTLDDPAGAFDLSANELRVPGHVAIAAISAQANMSAGKNGPIEAHVAASGVVQGRLNLAVAKVDITGTRSQHTMQLAAQGKPDVDLTGELAGGLEPHRGWSGRIVSLANRGRYALRLLDPASLAVSPGQFELRNASFALADGRLDMETVGWSPGKLSLRGAMSGLSLAYLQRLFPDQARADDVTATLTIGGRWSLQVGESINGSIHIAREGGDLTLVSEPPLSLGLSQLSLDVDIVQNRLKATADLQGKTTGTLNAHAETSLVQRDGVWGIPGDAPLTVEANGDIPSLAWTSLLLNPGYAVEGRARLRYTQTGTARAPQASGSLEADNLAFRISDYGVNLRDGILRANFDANRVVLSEFRMRADEGELTASGSVKLGKTESDSAEGGADIHADKLAILNHPDYRLTVSGDGKLALARGKLAITGQVRADHGSIRLPETSHPTLSDDVVVVGKTSAKARKPGATPISIDMVLDVGNDFTLTGYGLEATLRGNLRVKSAPPGLPTGAGAIRVSRGTYKGYGQKLQIDRGVLSFAGPIDNPTLDILAVRKNLAVEPGVAITGTALSPRVKLVSDPPVPDTEKLAWLTLGHGLEGSTGAEMELLPVAAAALLSSKGHSPTTGIAQTFGLDEIGLSRSSTSSTGGSSSTTGSTTAEQRVVTIGKRLSSKLYLTYEAGIDAASRVVRVQYEFSRRWSVRAETGTRSAVDLFYTLRFD